VVVGLRAARASDEEIVKVLKESGAPPAAIAEDMTSKELDTPKVVGLLRRAGFGCGELAWAVKGDRKTLARALHSAKSTRHVFGSRSSVLATRSLLIALAACAKTTNPSSQRDGDEPGTRDAGAPSRDAGSERDAGDPDPYALSRNGDAVGRDRQRLCRVRARCRLHARRHGLRRAVSRRRSSPSSRTPTCRTSARLCRLPRRDLRLPAAGAGRRLPGRRLHRSAARRNRVLLADAASGESDPDAHGCACDLPRGGSAQRNMIGQRGKPWRKQWRREQPVHLAFISPTLLSAVLARQRQHRADTLLQGAEKAVRPAGKPKIHVSRHIIAPSAQFFLAAGSRREKR
jgi:hypothetical protein